MERFESQLEELKTKQEISDTQVDAIKRELSMLKSDLKNFPKGAWLRTAFSRIFKLVEKFGKSKEGRELIMNTAKTLLSDGGS